MDKQTLTAFVLISLILMVWLYISTPQQPEESKRKPTAGTVDSSAQKDSAAVAAKSIRQPAPESLKADTSLSARIFPVFSGREKIISIENDVARFELTSKGGKIKKVFLKEYHNWAMSSAVADTTEWYHKWLQLLNASKGSSLDLEFLTTEGKKISSGDLEFKTSESRGVITLKGSDSLTIEYLFTTAKNQVIKKTLTFYGDKYDSRLRVGLENLNDLIAQNTVDLVWNAGIRFVEANSVDEANYANASVYYGGEQAKVDAASGSEKISQDFNGRVDWFCIRNKYFAAVVAPDDPSQAEGVFIKGNLYHFANHGMVEYYSARYKYLIKGNSFSTSLLVYTGPVSYGTLKQYNRNFDAIVDFGTFFGLKFIVRPIAEYVFLPLFDFLHRFIPNYGIVIIIFSLLIKILLHPLTRSSNLSMQKMQLLQPKITELKEKLKDDPTKQQKETMKLYSTYGINPMGGCFPMLLQMPVFIALWGVFQTAVELRQQHFVWWMSDLSRPDVIATLPFRIPIFAVNEISALALLMGITMFIQQKMTVKDPQQKAMVYIMPVMLTFLFMSFPSGLNLYYFCFNLLSIGQQYYLTHHTKGIVLEPVKKSDKKKGFFEKMMEAAEEKARTQTRKRK